MTPERSPNCNTYDFARCKKYSYSQCLTYGHTCNICEFDINKKRMEKQIEADGNIFVRGKLTDFEKLLFAEAEIKDLKKEISVLNIEIGQLKSFTQEQEATILSSKPDKGEIKKLRAISYNKQLLDANDKLRQVNKRLKKDNEELICKLISKSK